jgi:hypothetical protein
MDPWPARVTRFRQEPDTFAQFPQNRCGRATACGRLVDRSSRPILLNRMIPEVRGQCGVRNQGACTRRLADVPKFMGQVCNSSIGARPRSNDDLQVPESTGAGRGKLEGGTQATAQTRCRNDVNDHAGAFDATDELSECGGA